MKRKYYNVNLWEDVKNGMYKKVSKKEEKELVISSTNLLRNNTMLEEVMRDVIKKWKISTELNLTNSSCNQRAWLGQAACCYMHGCPEYLVKEAWNILTKEEQFKANNTADKIIMEWKDANK